MKKFTLREVRALVQQLDPTATVHAQAFRRAQRDGYCATVVRSGKLVGMGWIFLRQTLLRRQAVIEDMIVDAAWRRQGIATEVMKKLLLWAKKQAIEVVELTTNPKRVHANQLYRKVGFRLHTTNHYLLRL
ncbi:MAG: GNAT family N-acetyltransferase [bacterium]|nr:GNAT family N-acetyltransferase [bacterium]